jgi:MFS family permease
VAQDRSLRRVLIAAFAVALIFFQMTSTFGVAVTALGFSPRVYGLVISSNGLLIVLLELPLTTLTRRFPPLRVIAFGHLLVGAGFGLFAFARTVPALFACAFIFTLGEMCSMPVSSAYIADLAPAGLRGGYMGTYGLTWALGLILGPALGMKLFTWHPVALWTAGATLGALAAAFTIQGAWTGREARRLAA